MGLHVLIASLHQRRQPSQLSLGFHVLLLDFYRGPVVHPVQRQGSSPLLYQNILRALVRGWVDGPFLFF